MKQTTQIEPKLVSIKDTAASFGVSEKLVRKLIRTGELRSVRLGDRCLIVKSALDDLIKGE